MNKHQLARFVFDQTVRDWDFRTDFKRASMRCGLEGSDLVNRLKWLPEPWKAELADGRPVPVASWRPRQWQEFLDPNLVACLDQHDRISAQYYGRLYTPSTAPTTPASAQPASGQDVMDQDDNELPAAMAALDVEHSFEDFDSQSFSTTLESEDGEVIESEDREDHATLHRQLHATLAPPPPSNRPQMDVGGRRGASTAVPQARGARGARGRPRGGPRAPGRGRAYTRGGPPLCAKGPSAPSTDMGDDDGWAGAELQAGAATSRPAVDAPEWNAVWKHASSPSPAIADGPQARTLGRGMEGSIRQVPDWLTDPEARRAIGDGSAWLEREARGWYLRRQGVDDRRELVAGRDLDQALQELEDSRMLGDTEAWRYAAARPRTQRPARGTRLHQHWHETLVMCEWKSVRLETRMADAQDLPNLLLNDDEFWLEPDEYDWAMMQRHGVQPRRATPDPEEAESEDDPLVQHRPRGKARLDSQAGSRKPPLDSLALDSLSPSSGRTSETDTGLTSQNALYSAEDVWKRDQYFKSLDEWMEAKRGRGVRERAGVDGVTKVPLNRSLSADDEDDVIRDLRDGVFGKSVYLGELEAWAVDDRDSGGPVDSGDSGHLPALHSSDLARLCSVAQAYGWVEQEELRRRATLRSYALDDYQSFRFEPALSDDDTSAVLRALEAAHIRFAYAPDTEHRPGLLLVLHKLCPCVRELLERELAGYKVHEGEYQALIPMDHIPSRIHNRLCSFDYGEVQYWQAPLPPASLPPLGNLLPPEDQHAWLVPSKFTAWLKEDLMDNGWRCIHEAAESLQHRKVLVTGEWLSLRFLGGKPSQDVHEELVSGRFGCVVRLGDLMMRPTAIDYDLSMFIKDVYMIPQEQVEQVLQWLEPQALVRMEQEQKLQAQVETLKAEVAQTHPARGDDDDDDPARGDDANLPSEEILPEAQGERGVVNRENTQDQDGIEGRIEEVGMQRWQEVALQKAQAVALQKDSKDTWAPIELAQSRAPEEFMKPPSQAANGDAKNSYAATAAQSVGLSEEAEVAVKKGEEVHVEEEGSDQDTEVSPDLLESLQSEQRSTVSDMQQDGITTLTGLGPQGASAVAGSGTGFGALRYAVEKLHPSWRKELEEEFSSEYFMSIAKYLRAEVKLLGNSIYPAPDLIFHAFDSTPFDQVKVVILGQDPYHGAGQAHGLAFSVPSGVSAPPSLQNIFKELKEDPDVDFKPPPGKGGDLSPWARQGVLLLNSVLTVRAGDPLSHRDFGWEAFTDAAIRRLNDGRTNVIFVLWGANAHKKADIITGETHTVLMSSHPSPLSALKGRTPFLGCRHFSMINRVLRAQGAAEIDWSLS